ncbi:MAG: alpha/beta fold hydrolase [Solirubrobacterales bacterium]
MTLTSDSPRLYWQRHGEGEPLLWITGFMISAAPLDPVLDLYTDRFSCITYDHRLSGRSDKPLQLTSVPTLAADAVRVLDAAGVGSAHVYGISMGGMVAQEMAIRFPDRVRGLVLGGSTPGGPRAFRPGVRNLATLAGRMAATVTEPGFPVIAPALFTPEFRRDNPERTRELLRGFFEHLPPPPQGMAGHWWASVYHDTFSRLGSIAAPTLVVHGARDDMAPVENARLIAGRIPDAEVAIVPDAGHVFVLQRPELSRRLLDDWLDRKGPIGPGPELDGLAATAEPWTRRGGLVTGMVRTGASLLGLGFDTVAGRRAPPPPRSDPGPGHVITAFENDDHDGSVGPTEGSRQRVATD